MWYQLVAAVSIAAWAFVGTFVICVVIDHIPGLRLRQDPKSEMMGADPSEMAEPLITEVMVSLKELNQFPDASNKVSATQPVGATSKMDPDNIQRA